MADEMLQTQDAPVIPQELSDQMAIALNGGIIPQEAQATAEQTEVANTETTVVEPPVFTFDTLKEKFGYEKPEDALTEIEQLRALKAAPPKADLTFENEESEKLFKAWKSGKQDEVFEYLAEKKKLETLTSQEVNRDTAGDIIKLGMQLKYKDLTKEEIEYKFNKQFALPKQPVYNELVESEEDYQVKLDEWKERVADIEMSKIIEAKLAKPDLEGAKSKLVLPDLTESVDEGYIQYKKMLEDNAKLDEEVKNAYKALTTKQMETRVKFTDEASKVNFEFQYEPDSESFKEAVEIASDQNRFWSLFLNSDGSPNREMFFDAIYFAKNKEKVILEAIKQGSNARIKAQLADNDSGGLVRQLPQEQTVNELDAAMKLALGMK